MITTSILILTYNAPRHVKTTLKTLNKVTDPADRASCEVIVFDNASGERTKNLLRRLKKRGYIDKLHFSPENTFFARGNNLASELADPGSRYLLLLNSDVRIKQPDWLARLIGWKESGGFAAAAYGVTRGDDPRADGYCLLIDHEVFDRYRLDDRYHWWFNVTKMENEMMRDGYTILGVANHDDIIYHYGGGSGHAYRAGGVLAEQLEEVSSIFRESRGRITILDLAPPFRLIRYLRHKIKKQRLRIKGWG